MFGFLGKMIKFVFKGIGCLFMIIGFVVFMMIAGMMYLILEYMSDDFMPVTEPLPDSYALTLNVDEIYDVRNNEDLMTAFSTAGIGVAKQDVIKALEIASKDEKVKGLYAKMNDNWLGLADTVDIRKAVEKFKQEGKDTEIYSEVMGLSGTGASAYYLATSFDKIWLQPTGDFNFAGVSLESPFFKGLLDKIGVKSEIYARYEYKSGAESYTEEKMSEPVKQNMNSLLDSVYEELIKEISKAREISYEQVLEVVNEAPLTPQQALKAGLVDKTAYFDDFIKDREETVSVKKYINVLKTSGKWNEQFADVSKKSFRRFDKIAVINISGMIVSGSQLSPFFPEDIAAADDISKALREAAEDKDVKAIVLNINSGGGSYTASDVIRHTVEEVKTTKKIPVIAFMRSTAASGAYFVASAADRIIANPFTVTGSIGVFGGKPVINGLMEKLGVNVEIIKKGDNADMMTVTQPFTEKQQKSFQDSLDRVYADFTAKVAKARGLDKEQIDKVARGRIFTGAQAAENGLADEIGTWDNVLDYIAETTKTPKDDLVAVAFPKPKTNMDLLIEFLDSADISSSPVILFSALKRQMMIMNNATIVYNDGYDLK